MKLETVLEAIDIAKDSDKVLLSTMSGVKLTGGKKNPLQGKVVKNVCDAQVIFNDGQTYTNMIKEQMANEGKDPSEFKASERPWGKRVNDTPIIEHNGQYYLETIFVSAGDTAYLVDGMVTDKSEIEGLPKPKVSESSQGGVDNKVVVRTHKLDSITVIKVNDQVFK